MKVAICDMIFNKGHINFNKKIIECIKTSNEVFVFDDGNYYGNEETEKTKVYREPKGTIIGRIKMLINIKRQIKVLKRNKIDHILIMSYDPIMIKFVIKKLLKIAKVSIIQHNPSQFSSKIKKSFFNKYMNLIQHVVLDDFMITELVSLGVESSRVFCVNHPIYNFGENKQPKYDKILITALSGSNDEALIDSMLQYYTINKPLCNTNINMIIKSKKIEFLDDNLKIFTGYLSRDDYDSLFLNSCASIIFLPKSFLCRVSGVAFETLSAHKIIIGTSQPPIISLKNKYQSLVYTFDSFEELFNIIKNIKPGNIEDYLKFDNDHSNKNIAFELECLLKGN